MPENIPAPYASFGIFKGTIDTFAETVVPNAPLDRRILDTLSGADYGSLMSALRFLGLVDDKRFPTKPFRDLVAAAKDPGAFRTQLLALIESRYKPITGHVDVKTGSYSQLEKAFREYGVAQGQMLTKTIRFFVKMLEASGVTPSPHITKQQRSNGAKRATTETPRKKTPPAPSPSGGSNGHASDDIPPGFGRVPIPGLASAYIQYPSDITDANCDLFEAMVGVLRTYAKSRTGKEKKT